MIPLDLFNSDEMKKRRENAFAKALKTKPRVAKLDDLSSANTRLGVYSVNQYEVRMYGDADGQIFVACTCLASNPPIDEATGLPSREAMPCYHICSAMLYIAEQEKAK